MKRLVILTAALLLLGLALGEIACSGAEEEYLYFMGQSMEPTIHEGKVRVKAISSTYEIRRGDIVVFNPPDLPSVERIKRVVGLPGEVIEVDRIGSVYIDGQPLEEPYVLLDLLAYGRDLSGVWAIPEGEYFVLGDNRGVSYDSRNHGTVPAASITKRVVLEGTE